MINIVFIIRALEFGGAERQLVELVKGIDRSRFNVAVVTFYDGGALRPELEAIPDVKVLSLQKTGRWDLLKFLSNLITTIRAQKADIVHGYIDIPNIFSLLSAKITGAKSIFGVRSSSMDFSNYDWTAGATYRLANLFSPFADKIIVNSFAGLAYHIRNGMSAKQAVVIPNGIDTTRYQPDRLMGMTLRHKWNIAPHEQLIGLVGRIDPQKGHSTFLQAAPKIQAHFPEARFICIGDGPQNYWQSLKEQALSLNIDVIWPGGTQDMPSAYNALDLLVSASYYGEGFSNVIGEAMACGLPCVVTDAGDSARIVGDCGKVVPIKNVDSLTDAILTTLRFSSEQKQELARRARERILENFSVENLVRATEKVFTELVERVA